MIEWYQVISYSLTNGIRIFVCLLMAVGLIKSQRVERSAAWLALMCGMVTAVLYLSPIPHVIITALEILAIISILHLQYNCELRMCAFLTFFYEIAVAQWDFLFSAGLVYLFQYSILDGRMREYMIPMWIVRLLMLAFAAFAIKKENIVGKTFNRLGSIIAFAGMLCVLMLTEQSAVSFADDQLTAWVILSLILFMAVLFYRVISQYEMEKRIAQLETEKSALLERDYRILSDTYAANAKLFHDFHNHMDILHRYLSKGSTAEAMNYLEGLQSPIQVIAQTVWTGDEAADYLINSKTSLAASKGIRVKANIEFPRHTNIRSVDLVAILGNLLDNALEAAENAEDNQRFINLTIRRINDMLIIKVENGCSLASAMADGDLQTSKADKVLHGWGLKSVRTAAEHYDGTIGTEYSDHIFRAVVTLSFETV